jgi:hypothetical protein
MFSAKHYKLDRKSIKLVLSEAPAPFSTSWNNELRTPQPDDTSTTPCRDQRTHQARWLAPWSRASSVLNTAAASCRGGYMCTCACASSRPGTPPALTVYRPRLSIAVAEVLCVGRAHPLETRTSCRRNGHRRHTHPWCPGFQLRQVTHSSSTGSDCYSDEGTAPLQISPRQDERHIF